MSKSKLFTTALLAAFALGAGAPRGPKEPWRPADTPRPRAFGKPHEYPRHPGRPFTCFYTWRTLSL